VFSYISRERLEINNRKYGKATNTWKLVKEDTRKIRKCFEINENSKANKDFLVEGFRLFKLTTLDSIFGLSFDLSLR
jgi:hypothetical protein